MKKILSLLLSVTICLSFMVIPASATETMPEVTDFSGYDLVTDVASQTITNYSFKDLNMKGDYVVKFSYTQRSSISSAWSNIAIYAGGNIFRILPLDGDVYEICYNDVTYDVSSGSWSDVSAVRTVNGTLTSDAWNKKDSAKDISSWYSNDNTTKYDVYISKIDGAMTFGIKKNTDAAYDYFNTTCVNPLAENDILIRTMEMGINLENLKVYSKKIPMPEVTDFSGYELKTDVSSLNVSSYDIDFRDLDMKGDYVIKLTYKQNAAISSSNAYMYAGFFAGGNAFVLSPVDKVVRESSWNGTPYNPTNAASGSWADQNAIIRTKTGNTGNFAFNIADSSLDITSWYSNDNTTKYDVYISKIDGVMTFGIKNNTATTYDWFNTQYVSTLEENDFLIRNFTSGGLSVENLKIYTEKIPMPEVTDFSGYDLVTDVASQTITNYSFKDLNMKGDYVVKFSYTQRSSISDAWSNIAIYAGGNIFRILPLDGDVYEICYNDVTYDVSSGSWSDLSAVRTLTGTSTSDAWNKKDSAKDISSWYSNDNTTKYDVYISKIDGAMTFGIKKNTDAAYDYFNTTYVNPLAENDILIRTMAMGINLENLKVYSEPEIITDITYTEGTGTVTVDLGVTRNAANVSDTAVLITAVYVTKDGVKRMENVMGTDEKALTLSTEVPFSNTVTVPAAGEGETVSVVSYLWDSYNGLVPITNAFVMD